MDPCEFLTQTYGHDPDSLLKDLDAVCTRMEELDYTWRGRSLQSFTCRVLSHW